MSAGTAGGRGLFRKKPVEAFVAETGPDAEGGELERSIGLFQLTMFGVGATIGTGIFIVLTEAVPEAGPAVIFSFVLAGITAALTAVCYAELASDHPRLRLVLLVYLRHAGRDHGVRCGGVFAAGVRGVVGGRRRWMGTVSQRAVRERVRFPVA